MQTYRDLDKARAVHADLGGWLLDLGGDGYLVTDDEGLVRDLRADMIEAYGAAWMEAIAAVGHDETNLDLGWRMDPSHNPVAEFATEAAHFWRTHDPHAMEKDDDQRRAARAPDPKVPR